jgi:hypothetical protein
MKGVINLELPAAMAMPLPMPPVCKKRTVAGIGTSAMAEGTINSTADCAELLSKQAELEAADIRVEEEKRKNTAQRRKLAAATRHLSMRTLCSEMQRASGEDISIQIVPILGHDYIVAHDANLLPATKQNEILGKALTQDQRFHMTTIDVCGDADAMQLRYNTEGGLLWGRLCGAAEDSASGGLAERAMPALYKHLHGQWYLLANVSQVSGHASCARPAIPQVLAGADPRCCPLQTKATIGAKTMTHEELFFGHRRNTLYIEIKMPARFCNTNIDLDVGHTSLCCTVRLHRCTGARSQLFRAFHY